MGAIGFASIVLKHNIQDTLIQYSKILFNMQKKNGNQSEFHHSLQLVLSRCQQKIKISFEECREDGQNKSLA